MRVLRQNPKKTCLRVITAEKGTFFRDIFAINTNRIETQARSPNVSAGRAGKQQNKMQGFPRDFYSFN